MKQQNKIADGKVLRKIGMKEYLIPANWEVVNLSSISTLKGRIGWEGLTRKEYLKEGDYYLVTGTDFKDFNVNWDSCVFVNKERYDQDENIQLKEKDILITKDGSIGKIAFVRDLPGKATLNSGIFVVRPTNEKYTPEYLYRIMQSRFFDLFMNVIAGSTIAHLYQRDFVNFEFPMPPIPEQQAISKILSEVDLELDVIDKESKATERLKRGIMVKLLKDTNLVELKEIFEIITGTTPSTKDKRYWENSNINWITPIDLGKLDGQLEIMKSQRKINNIAVNETNLTIMPKESIIISTRAPVGYLAVIQEESTFNQGCKGLIPKNKEEVNPYYYAYYLLYKKYELQNRAGQSTFKELSKDMFEKFLVPKIDIITQNKIVSILSTIDKKIELEQRRKNKIERIKKGLMNDLLTGNKSVDVENVLKIGGGK